MSEGPKLAGVLRRTSVKALLLFALSFVCAISLGAWAAPSIKRARPPQFGKSINDVFFADAREKLVGSRPPRASVAVPAAADATPETAPLANGAGARPQWSKLIAAETVEDEIKSQQRKLADRVKNVAKFKGGDYKMARVHLGILATLFAIDAQYDQPMRWQREASAARGVAAKASFNCKVGTDASYREARQVADDIESLIRGGTIDASPGGPQPDWSKVADRSLLMKRLEQAHEQGLAPWTSNAGEFSRHGDALQHEAQIVAALAEVMQCEGYELADDEAYRQYAGELQKHALAVRDAASQNSDERARQAVGEMAKACASCHEGYRN